jgi:urease accessory protein
MNTLNRSILSALCSRQRLWLVLGFVLVSGIILFNSLTIDVSGWHSGFIHPLHGGDHFLTMLAVGIWAAQLRGKAIWLLPVTFVSVMSLGGLAGAAGLFIPSAELIILLSGLVFSIFIARKIRFSNKISVIIVAFFAFFHGFAHGQEISTSASLISYTLGFMVATLLLHSAGILIVKLCVIIFALFISHLAYAQSSNNNLMVKSTAYTVQTDSAHEFFMAAYPAPPDDSRNYRQLLYSGEDGSGGKTTTGQHHNTSPPTSMKAASFFVRVIHRASCDIAARWFSPDWSSNQQQLGTHFLTSGVGLTSPPVAVVFDSSSRFCFATVFFCVADLLNGNQVFKTIPRFDLPNPQTLATSFLTNGVGATSPPVWLTLPVVASFTIVIPLSCFSALFLSHLLISSILKTQWSRFKSRSPTFAFFIDLLSWSSHFIKQPYKNNTEKEDAHTTNSTL